MAKKRKKKSSVKTKCICCDKLTVERYDGEYCCSRCRFETERLDNYALLASIGVPFNDLGEPVGIWH